MFFFFFKQKTAYEMRISDWSSDVCSSDQRPQRIRGGLKIVAGIEHATAMAFRNEHQRVVDRHHLDEEDRDVHDARLWHAIVARPGAVILAPLSDITVEGGLRVALVLLLVELLANHLLDRPEQSRVTDAA